jgi:lysozyme
MICKWSRKRRQRKARFKTVIKVVFTVSGALIAHQIGDDIRQHYQNNYAMKLSETGASLIQKFEELRLQAYADTGGVWTIGWGHTANVFEGMIITLEQATDFFSADIRWAEEELQRLFPEGYLTQNQFDALTSFIFNVGLGQWRRSTLLRRLLINPDHPDIPFQFRRWVKDNGKIQPGLVARRERELELYLSPSP